MEKIGMKPYCLLILLGTLVVAQPAQRLPLPQEAAINLPAQPAGPGDLRLVSIYDQPALSRTVRVSSDGFIRLPMLKHKVNATGLLPGDLESAIAKAYQNEGILVDPQVTVNLAEYHSRPIQVGGAVRRPVTFQAESPITLLEAINRAEGLTDLAGPEILVTRSEVGANGVKKTGLTQRVAVKTLFESGDESANLVLRGGEEVRVPEAGRVFVVGNVKRPCQFPLKQGEATLLQALAYSEGLLRYSTKTAYIYRREANGEKSEIPVELKKIIDRKAPDVRLQADDILYIPENGKKRMSMAAITTLVSVGGGAAAYAAVVSR